MLLNQFSWGFYGELPSNCQVITKLYNILLFNAIFYIQNALAIFELFFRNSLCGHQYIVFEITTPFTCLQIRLYRQKSLGVAHYACVFIPAHSNPHSTRLVQLFTKRCTRKIQVHPKGEVLLRFQVRVLFYKPFHPMQCPLQAFHLLSK